MVLRRPRPRGAGRMDSVLLDPSYFSGCLSCLSRKGLILLFFLRRLRASSELEYSESSELPGPLLELSLSLPLPMPPAMARAATK